jgi:hypothetical protein
MWNNSINNILNRVVYTTFKTIPLRFAVSPGFQFASRLPKYKIISFEIFKNKFVLKDF